MSTFGKLRVAAVLLACLATTAQAQLLHTEPEDNASLLKKTDFFTSNNLAREVANRYGFEAWDQIQTLTFGMDLQLNADTRIQRNWEWDVKKGVATLRYEKDGQVLEEQLDLNGPISEDSIPNHKRFTYDTYWLLFPFQLVWSNPQLAEGGHQFTTVPGGTFDKLICQWPAEGGYTPGDTYDLYLYPDKLVRHWDFSREAGMIQAAAVWTGHHQLGPIILCLEFKSYPAEDGFVLKFVDVEAELIDGTVVKPEPMESRISPDLFNE